MDDSELHRAAEEYAKPPPIGKLHEALERLRIPPLRVVHPMDTYRDGRGQGMAAGILISLLLYKGHEAWFHGWHHVSFWGVTINVFLILLSIYSAWWWWPNKYASDIRRSIRIYEDEKK